MMPRGSRQSIRDHDAVSRHVFVGSRVWHNLGLTSCVYTQNMGYMGSKGVRATNRCTVNRHSLLSCLTAKIHCQRPRPSRCTGCHHHVQLHHVQDCEGAGLHCRTFRRDFRQSHRATFRARHQDAVCRVTARKGMWVEMVQLSQMTVVPVMSSCGYWMFVDSYVDVHPS